MSYALEDPNNDYESPCVRNCVINQRSGYCEGCGRTLREISYWTRYSAGERHRILQALPARKGTSGQNDL